MLPPNTRSAGRLTRRLDSWFPPRWRALIIWMMLAGISGAFIGSPLSQMIGSLKPVKAIEPFLQPMPDWLMQLTIFFYVAPNYYGPATWFQPTMLRLSLRRWIIWMILVPFMAAPFNLWHDFFGLWAESLALWFWPSIAGILLIGCRSRPWMTLPAGALALGIDFLLRRVHGAYYSLWLLLPATNFLYATVMLYGTHPLRPTEGVRVVESN